MTVLPRVTAAEARSGFRIRVTFGDGTAGTVDFRRWLHGPVFEPLKDPKYFRTFFLDGQSIEWPNGASIAPETLYDAARSGAKAARKPSPARKPAGKKRTRRTL
jgi:hypothetical protein